jgi:hypothetical protein
MSVRALNLLKVALLTSLVAAGCSADTGSTGMPTSPVIIPSTATALLKPPTSRPATMTPPRNPTRWTILHTNDARGYVDPCG